jgi:hypothetical protein
VSNDEDVVMAIKARWARALDLEDETMSVVALEKATRRQREAMENAMAADIKHTEALISARREILSWLRAMGKMFPVEAASAAFLADEYEKAAARADDDSTPCDPPYACGTHGRCWAHSDAAACESAGCDEPATGIHMGDAWCSKHDPRNEE